MNSIDNTKGEFDMENTTHESQMKNRVGLEQDLVGNYLQRFLGEWNQSRKENSELLNAIYRSDFRQFSGKPATDNVVDE